MTAPAADKTLEQFSGKMSKSEFETLLEKEFIKDAVWINPFGAEEDTEVPLSPILVRKYIAEPAKDKETGQEILPSDQECKKFIQLCKSRKLNPWEGDAYMIPYWDKRLGRHRWSLITAHAAFLKRAELHPQYDGMDSGVIVQRSDGKILELPGDFRLDTDKLLGGWANIFKKNQSHPIVRKVRLSTYIKDFGVWAKDPEGMICKVAEAQGLRDAFPTVMGGMYMREEMSEQEGKEEFQRLVNQDAKKPDLGRAPEPEPDKTSAPEKTDGKKRDRKGRPTLVEEPLDPNPLATQPAAQQISGARSSMESPTGEKPNGVTGSSPAASTTLPAQQSSVAPTPPAVATLALPQPVENETIEQATARYIATIEVLAQRGKIAFAQLMAYLKSPKGRWMKDEQTKLQELSGKKLEAIAKAWVADEPGFVKRIMEAQPK